MSKITLTILTILSTFSGLFACTIFNVSNGEQILIGNNEDWRHSDSNVKFIPASKNKFGRVYFGFGKSCRYVFGGINDKGLFYDLASVRKRDDIIFDPQQKIVDNEIYEKMLETCSSIDEAIALLKRYNINGLKRHHIMIVEKTGKSVIVEWGADSLSIVRKSKDYQIMTNFNNTLSKLNSRQPGGRYKLVEEQIEKSDNISVDDVRLILETVKNSGMDYPTVYSNIYDLTNNEIYLYHNHNFDEYLKIDINKQLDKDIQSFYIPLIFSNLALKEPSFVAENKVELKWKGNADRYKLFISNSPDFNLCNPIEINNTSDSSVNKSSFGFFLLILLPFIFFLNRNRKLQLISCLFFSLFVVTVSCNESLKISENKEYSYLFSKAEKNKTYYWKIQAFKETDIMTESVTKQFSTIMLEEK